MTQYIEDTDMIHRITSLCKGGSISVCGAKLLIAEVIHAGPQTPYPDTITDADIIKASEEIVHEPAKVVLAV